MKRYSVNQIILNEHFGVTEYIENGGIKRFSKEKREHIEQYNLLIRKLFELLESIFAGCHIIRFPRNVMADKNNKWGLCELHYQKLYYEYGAQALKICVDKNDNKKEKLDHLCEEYSLRCELYKCQIKLKDSEFEKTKLQRYADFFMDLLINPAVLRSVEKFIYVHQFSEVAFYGDFMSTAVLKRIACDCGVRIKYVICDWNQRNIAEQYVPTRQEKYPNVDAIIICDVIFGESIKRKIAHMNIPVYNLTDILGETGKRD